MRDAVAIKRSRCSSAGVMVITTGFVTLFKQFLFKQYVKREFQTILSFFFLLFLSFATSFSPSSLCMLLLCYSPCASHSRPFHRCWASVLLVFTNMAWALPLPILTPQNFQGRFCEGEQ